MGFCRLIGIPQSRTVLVCARADFFHACILQNRRAGTQMKIEQYFLLFLRLLLQCFRNLFCLAQHTHQILSHNLLDLLIRVSPI